jgi:hypothetical protein
MAVWFREADQAGRKQTRSLDMIEQVSVLTKNGSNLAYKLNGIVMLGKLRIEQACTWSKHGACNRYFLPRTRARATTTAF